MSDNLPKKTDTRINLMAETIGNIVESKIDKLPYNFVFTIADFVSEQALPDNVRKKLNRLAAAGKIQKVGNGKYIKPLQSEFGQIQPSVEQLTKDLLEKNRQPIGYITGNVLFNQMGLTTQISSRIQIATRKIRKPLTRGRYTITFVLQPNAITAKNIPLLQILDALKSYRKIPACTPDEAVTLLKQKISTLSAYEQCRLSTLAVKYTNYVRALLGCILENCNGEPTAIETLRRSLNGMSVYRLNISQNVLSNQQKWNIK